MRGILAATTGLKQAVYKRINRSIFSMILSAVGRTWAFTDADEMASTFRLNVS